MLVPPVVRLTEQLLCAREADASDSDSQSDDEEMVTDYKAAGASRLSCSRARVFTPVQRLSVSYCRALRTERKPFGPADLEGAAREGVQIAGAASWANASSELARAGVQGLAPARQAG